MPSIHKFLRFTVSAALLMTLGGIPVEAEAAMYDTRENDRITQRTVRLYPNEPPPGTERDQTPPRRPRTEPEPEPGIETITPSLRSKIRQKKRHNADVVGWLQVPGTDIDQVIVQNPTKNNPYSKQNEYYLNRNFSGQPDKNGTLCADYRASFGSGKLSRITTIYGHSWDDDPDGEVFAQLKRYRDPSFARNHPYIFFSTESQDMAWEVFAVFDTTIYLPYVRPSLSSDVFYQTLDMVYDMSYYSYDVAVDASDRILALSTCTFSVEGHDSLPEINDYRFVVMARLVEPETPPRSKAVFAVNTSPLPPDATYSMRYL